jgi:hypothetical protein
MPEKDLTTFSREKVEQQIKEHLIQVEKYNARGRHTPAQQVVCDLQQYYAPGDHHASLQRVWLRFRKQEAAWQQSAQTSLSPSRIVHLAHWRKDRGRQTPVVSVRKATVAHYVGTAAILAASVFIVGKVIQAISRNNRKWIQSSVQQSTPSLITAHE